VFMAGSTNAEGKHVFGNADMQVCLPEEKYQHFYEGLPSTNGLSGKWIDEMWIYPRGIPPDVSDDTAQAAASDGIPWLPIALGVSGLLLIGLAVYVSTSKRTRKEAT